MSTTDHHARPAGRASRRRGRPDLGALAPELRGLTRRTTALGVLTVLAAVGQSVLLAHAIALGVEGRPATHAVVTTLAALASLVVLRGALGAVAEVDGRRTGHRAVAALRRRVVGTTLASASAGTVRPGALAATAVHGADAVAAYAGRYVPQRSVATVGPVLALAVVAWVDPLSAAVLACAVPVVIAFLILVGMQARDAAEEQALALQVLDGHLLDVLRGLPVLRAHGREHVQAEQIDRAGDRYRRGTMTVLRAAFLSGFVLEFVAMLGTALVAVVCGVRLAAGDMAFGPAITALVLAPEVFAPLRRLGAEYHAAADAEPVLRELVDGLGRDGLVPEGTPGGPVPDAGHQPIVLRGVRTAEHGRDRPALDGLDLEVVPGRTTALLGASGAGKTTALRLLAGLRLPAEGTITCGGTALPDADLQRWRATVGWIPQHPALLPATLRENVLVGRDASDAAVRDALGAAGLADLVAALPDGLESVLGDGGLPLSAGERRRLGVARAMVGDPRLVLIDEPTANLDATSAAHVLDALRTLVRGRTAVLCTHDDDALCLADRTIRLEGGRASAPAGSGPHAEGAASVLPPAHGARSAHVGPAPRWDGLVGLADDPTADLAADDVAMEAVR